MNLRDHLAAASKKLQGSGQGGAPRLEAEVLLAHALEVPRSFLYAHDDLELPGPRRAAFSELLRRRMQGEPIAYLTGVREFWSLPIEVTPDVLIPRPETELLVEAALRLLQDGRPARVADIGTGSGAIALAIASERPKAEVTGTDLSWEAVELARRNATRLRLGNAGFRQGSWCEPLQGPFELVVSNPPYVARGDPHLGAGDCRFEPALALCPGADALSAFRAICEPARAVLAPGGWLLFEHGFEQGPAVRRLLDQAGYEEVGTRTDLEGRERVSLGRLGRGARGATG